MSSSTPIYLAVEDILSDAVLRAILRQSGRAFDIGACYQRQGSGYLRNRIAGFNQAARGTPFLVLTDLDKGYPCASSLITDWLRIPQHPNLLFRVAVREVESWVLADREAFSPFLGIRVSLIPGNTDELPDPKQFLIEAVRKSRKRDLRSAILPRPNSTAKQGPDYNRPLIQFVQEKWDAARAAKASPSLERAIIAIRRFRQTQ